MKSLNLLPIILLGSLFVSGCSQQSMNDAQQDANHDIAVANQKADQVAAKAKPDLQALDLGTRVTVALRANLNLPTTISVAASPNGVRLAGKVSSRHQRALAGEIAKQTLGPGQTVQNNIKIEQ